ncbi:MAG: 8-oxo-dGTP diphosphatase [Thermoplasmata archaeon]|jgi:8-oxo-dGTP diphosphatase|nr:8-oxo-dGTP diphosphatase [Thermoplasmata archaeon]
MTLAPTSGTKTKANEAAELEYTVIVATRDTRDGKEFLMVHHGERGWELPGGKLEPNEGPVHCALREFREETGHLLGSPHFVAKLRKDNGVCFIFTGTLGSAVESKDKEEVVGEMRWFGRLPRELGLAFPDDPYAEMGQMLGIDFG